MWHSKVAISTNMLSQVTLLALTCISSSSLVCGEVSAPPTTANLDTWKEITLTSGLVGAVAIIAGLLMCFLGKRFFKLFLGLVGLMAGAVIGIHGLALVGGYVAFNNWVAWAVIIICALLISSLAFYAWSIGVYIGAGMGGYLLTAYILSLKAGGFIEGYMTRNMALLIGTIIAVVAAFFLEDLVVVITSAISGAMCTAVGADIYLNTGFRHQIYDMIVSRTITLHSYDKMFWYLYAGTCCLAIAGIVVQLVFPSKGFGRDK